MRQITEAIAGGRLKAGEKLSSHRDLSEQLVIAPLTVKKAYDELELLGFLETQRGRGTYVCVRLPQPDPLQQMQQVRDTARKPFRSEEGVRRTGTAGLPRNPARPRHVRLRPPSPTRPRAADATGARHRPQAAQIG